MSAAPDAIVVGGGVFGCAVAYELARRDVSVLLLDKHQPGRATSASAGGLWPIGEAVGLGCGVIHHAKWDGGEAAAEGPKPLPDVFRAFLIESRGRFEGIARTLRHRGGIDVEYEVGQGLLFVAHDDAEVRFIEALIASLPDAQQPVLLDPAAALRLEPGLTRELRGAAWLKGEDQVNPMLLCEGYRRAAIALGARARSDVLVTGLRRDGNRVVGVELDGAFLPCGTVVNAAGAWAGRLASTADLVVPVEPVRGQVVLTETLPRTLAGCLSTSDCYLAQKSHGEVLIGSTTEYAGFDVSVTEEAIQTLCEGAIRVLPGLRDVRVRRVWAGLRPGTRDELPILGRMGGVEGYLNATGGFRTGIVAAPLAGEVVAQTLVGEKTSTPLGPYRVERFSESSAAA